jgi:hypothetical protein
MRPIELMDLEALAAWLKVSKRTAQDLAKNFPTFHLKGSIKRYEREEILVWLKQQRTLRENHQDTTAGLHPRKRKAAHARRLVDDGR